MSIPRADLQSLHLLLFSAGAVSFAADLEQIAAMRDYQEGADAEGVHWFPEEVGMPAVAPAQYLAPTVLTVRGGAEPPYRVVVDAMQDIVEVPIGEIRPFPSLVAPRAQENGMWGIIPRSGTMVFLVDLERLSNGKCCAKRREG